MTNRFYLPSLAIELDANYFEFDENFIYVPSKFNNPILRFYIHEVLHFWQTLSQGFITNLALQEWLQLLDYETKKTYICNQERKQILNSFRKIHPKLGFSAFNLSEALCRFWDIHIMGPKIMLEIHKDNIGIYYDYFLKKGVMTGDFFDFLMLEIEDTYAEPYNFCLKQWGTRATVVLFPIIGYFSLQTPSPVEVFADAINSLLKTAFLKFLNRYEDVTIHYLWRRYYTWIKDECYDASLRICNKRPKSSFEVIRESELADHPVFKYYLYLLKLVKSSIGWDSWEIDYNFSLPGEPYCRSKLGKLFRPPVTIFYNGRWTGKSLLNFAPNLQNQGIPFPELEIEKIQDPEILANSAEEITKRYLKMCLANKLK